MPPFDPTQNPYPQPDMPQYLADQNNILANQQLQFQNQTIYAAQSRMQANLQATLQGTMNAAMAASQGFASIAKPFHEKIYNDLYFGNGQYALQRSLTRDILFGTGIAQSAFGRDLQIGGRKPEFLDKALFYHEMHRSVDLRKEELGDSLISGGFSGAGAALGMSMGFIPGMLVGAGFDFVAEGINQRRQYSRDIREFSAITDLNKGAGNRRLSAGVASELASSFMPHDLNFAQALPLIGDRFRPDTSYGETFKKMGSLGLLRDNDLNDIKGLEKTVKDTAKFIEEFAGLAKMTKDEALKLKATFNNMGFKGGQQTTAMNALLGSSYSTGIDVNTLASIGTASTMSGLAMGFSAQSSFGNSLTNINNIKALQEAGIINRNYDAASLSVQRTQTEQAFAGSTVGAVLAYGGVGDFKAKLSKMGNGDVSLGYELFKSHLFEGDKDAKTMTNDAIDNIYGKFGMKGVLGFLDKLGLPQDAKREALEHLTGNDKLADKFATDSAASSRAGQLGIDVSQLSLTDFANKNFKAFGGITLSKNQRAFNQAQYIGLGSANSLLSTDTDNLVSIKDFWSGTSFKNDDMKNFANDPKVKSLMQNYINSINGTGDPNKTQDYFNQMVQIAESRYNAKGDGKRFVIALLKYNNSFAEDNGNSIQSKFKSFGIRMGNINDMISGYNPDDVNSEAVNKIKNLTQDQTVQLMQLVSDGSTSSLQKVKDILGVDVDKNFNYDSRYTTLDKAGNEVERTRTVNIKAALQQKLMNGDLTSLKQGQGFRDFVSLRGSLRDKSETEEAFQNRLASEIKDFVGIAGKATSITDEESRRKFIKAANDIYGDSTGDTGMRMARMLGNESGKWLQNLVETGAIVTNLTDDQRKQLNVMTDNADKDLNNKALYSLSDACQAIAHSLDKDYKANYDHGSQSPVKTTPGTSH